MILRGLYLANETESDIFYKTLSNHFPELAHEYIGTFPDSAYGFNDLDIFRLFQLENDSERIKTEDRGRSRTQHV